MKFEEFIEKWICTDEWSMMHFQGKVAFQGMTALFTFPPKEGDRKQVFAVYLTKFKDTDFEHALDEINNSLCKYYGVS